MNEREYEVAERFRENQQMEDLLIFRTSQPKEYERLAPTQKIAVERYAQAKRAHQQICGGNR